MADVPGVDDVEHAVTHDHLARARARPDELAQLLDRLDLALVLEHRGGIHHPVFSASVSNQRLVAAAIEAASHRGASRQ